MHKTDRTTTRKKTPRLHIRGTVLGYRRSREVIRPNQVLIRMEDVKTRADAAFYVGKRIAYYYNASSNEKNGSKIRIVWGKITGVHGNSGVVKARFRKNLTGDAIAQTCRVFLFPSLI